MCARQSQYLFVLSSSNRWHGPYHRPLLSSSYPRFVATIRTVLYSIRTSADSNSLPNFDVSILRYMPFRRHTVLQYGSRCVPLLTSFECGLGKAHHPSMLCVFCKDLSPFEDLVLHSLGVFKNDPPNQKGLASKLKDFLPSLCCLIQPSNLTQCIACRALTSRKINCPLPNRQLIFCSRSLDR